MLAFMNATAVDYEWDWGQPQQVADSHDVAVDQPPTRATLVAGVVHDFNNLVHIIAANAWLGRAAFDAGRSANEYLDNILLATERAQALAKQLSHAYARPRYVREHVDLIEIVQETLELVRARVPEGAAIETSFAEDAPTILADATQLQRVVMNLCINAFQALEAAMTTRPKVLQVRVELVDAHNVLVGLPGSASHRSALCLSVRDNGIGMDTATRACLFEPFFTQGAHDGTGLGLSIVHGIVTAHGGAITVDSAEGQGAHFRVYLPVPAPRTPSLPRRPGGG